MMMASSSRKNLQARLFLAAALLFLICTRGLEARPAPAGFSGSMAAQHPVPSQETSGGSSGPGGVVVMDHGDPAEAMRDCVGGEEQEECLMRRTLVAHTDYIYTQGNHN